ncbi:MAG: GNAT family N-acetyltransferase [Terriglobales bacterium]
MNYEIAKPPDAEEIIRLLAAVFSESEPPAVAMGLNFREMEHLLELLAPHDIADELTIVARCTDTGRLAGALLTDDFGRPSPLDVSKISPKFLPIFSMLETLDEQFRSGNTIVPGRYLHLFMLAVDREFAGRGIAKEMVAACLDNGARKGYRGALTEATGRISQSVFRKQGFVERFSVSYRDFRYENKLVFASIQEHERTILMEKALV